LPVVEGASDIISAEGAIICQSSAPEHSSENLYCGLEGGGEPRRLAAAGFWLGNLHEKATLKAASTLA
jgi:hypothetical protein